MEQLDTQKSPKIPWSLEGGGSEGGVWGGGGGSGENPKRPIRVILTEESKVLLPKWSILVQ